MSLISTTITPIIKGVFVTGFIIWIAFMIIYTVFKLLNPQRRLWIKYKLLRKQYNTEDVKYCMDAVNKDFSEIDLKKHLLLNGTKEKRVEEVIFIFKEVYKQLKGGTQYNGRSEKSNAEAKLPKV